MVDQTMGFWRPAGAKKPTKVGFSVGGDLTNVPLCAVLLVATCAICPITQLIAVDCKTVYPKSGHKKAALGSGFFVGNGLGTISAISRDHSRVNRYYTLWANGTINYGPNEDLLRVSKGPQRGQNAQKWSKKTVLWTFFQD